MDVIIKVRDIHKPSEWVDIELVSGCSWDAVTTAISTQLGLLSREEIISVQSIDADGEPLSAKINSGPKFWAIVGNSFEGGELWFEVQHDAILAEKLAKALEYEQFRASAAHLCFSLASDVEQAGLIYIKYNCSWDELLESVAKEFSNIPKDWIHHFILVDSVGDELSDVLNTDSKFWKFASTYSKESGNVFVIHFDEEKIADMARLEEEKKFKESAQQLRIRLVQKEGPPEFGEVFLPHNCSWADIQSRTAAVFDIMPQWIEGFFFLDGNEEKLSSKLTNSTKFWKFASGYDPSETSFFDLQLNWADVATYNRKKEMEKFRAEAYHIVVQWKLGGDKKTDVFLPRNCSWSEILSVVAEALDIPVDFISSLIWRDEDGDELSPPLQSDAKFWRLSDKFNLKEGQYYLVCENKEAVDAAEQLRKEKEFENFSKSFKFKCNSNPDVEVELSISPTHSKWNDILAELAPNFPPLQPEWISGFSYIYKGKIGNSDITSVEKMWDCFERLREKSSTSSIPLEQLMANGVFLINEYPEFREKYLSQLEEEKLARDAAERSRQEEELKSMAKEIVFELAGMPDTPTFTLFVPLLCKSWDELTRLIATSVHHIEAPWISYIILVDSAGDELSVPITDIQKFWKLCGDEYTVLSGYRFMVHLDQKKIAEVMAAREFEEFRRTAARFIVKFKYLDQCKTGEVFVNQNCEWDELILAICQILDNIVNVATIDFIKMKDGTDEDISSPIRSSDKFWLVFPTYNVDHGMYFEVSDSESLSMLEEEAKKSELLAGRVVCRFKVKDPELFSFGEDVVPSDPVDVFVPSRCEWDALTDSVSLGFPMIPPAAITNFVLVDAEGDELSMKIDSAAKFWKIFDSYNLSEGFVLMLYADPMAVRQYAEEIALKRFRATAASFRVYMQKDDGSKGPETEVFVSHDCDWRELADAVLVALELDMKGLDLKTLVLVDAEGDALSPSLTNDSKFWKIYHKNKKIFDKSIVFSAQLSKVNLIDQLHARKNDSLNGKRDTNSPQGSKLPSRIADSPHSSLLEDACLKGDIGAVLSLLNAGADVNSRNEAGTQPIHFASVIGSVELARLLIAAGADVSATNNEGSTPLHFACEQGHEDLIMYFISANASLTVANASGIVPLDYLCSQGNDRVVLEVMRFIPHNEYGLLLRLAAEHGIVSVVTEVMESHIAPVDGEDADQRTAMHFACLNGNVDVAKVLISYGANIRSKDVDGMTPILYACSSGNLKLVKYLIAHGSKALLDDVDVQLNDALQIGCRMGHLDLVQWLVKLGMDTTRINIRGQNAAACAEESGFPKIDKWIKQFASKISNSATERASLIQQLQVYCSAGAVSEIKRVIEMGVDINGKGEGGNTPFHMAVANGNIEVARLLFDAAGDVNATNDVGYTPLIVACIFGHLDIVKWFREIGVSANSSSNGTYAIHFAALLGRYEIVDFLLESGVPVNMPNTNGWTPLHEACNGNSLDVARLLYERGADVNSADRYGVTSLHIASYRGFSILAQWLLFSGADIECEDAIGRTPLLYSALGGELKTAMLLDEKGADIHVTTESGDNALHLAALRSHVHIIDWLIGKGLDINALNEKKQTPYQVSLVSCNKGATDFFGSYFLQSNLVQPEAVVYQVAYEIFRTTNESNYPSARFCLEELMRRVEPMYRLPGDCLILHFAAAASHINLIKYLLSKGCPVNAQSSTGRTPLHYAAIKGHVQVGSILIEAGADYQLKDATGKSPMEYAIQNHQKEFAEFLRSRNDLKQKEDPGFIFACLPVLGSTGAADHAEGFVSPSTDSRDDYTNRDSKDDIEVVESFHAAAPADWIEVPYAIDIVNGNIAVLTKLKAEFTPANKDPDFVPLSSAPEEKEETPMNNLHMACSAGNLQHVQTLSGKGTDLNVKNTLGLTPLYIACDKQYGDIAIYLIKKGADLGVMCAPGDTPMHRICARGMSSLLEQIVASKLSVKVPFDAKSSNGLTLMHVTAKAGFIGIMKILVKNSSVMNARDSSGKTALHYVCESGNLELAEFLLNNGAFLNVRDDEGCTPIALAIKNEHFEICKLLGKNGASMTAEDNEGNSLLHLACKNGNVDIIMWLISSGADRASKNAELKTAEEVLAECRFVAALAALQNLDEDSV